MNIFKAYFLDVITQKYFQISGRAPRREFWYFMLFSIIFSFLFGMVGQMLGLFYMIPIEIPSINETGQIVNSLQNIPINLVQAGFGLALFFPTLAVSIRRLHDLDKSGWWYLIAIIPLLGALVLLAFFVTGSQEHENRYGDIPNN